MNPPAKPKLKLAKKKMKNQSRFEETEGKVNVVNGEREEEEEWSTELKPVTYLSQ